MWLLIYCHIHTLISSRSASLPELLTVTAGAFSTIIYFCCWGNVWSSQLTSSECKAPLEVCCTAACHQQPGLSMPRINTPQGQTGKTHKAWSINYLKWRQLSVADKCVLQFRSCFSLQFKLEGGTKEAQLSINMHFIPSNEQTPQNTMQFSKLNGNKCKEEWERGLWKAVRACVNFTLSGGNLVTFILVIFIPALKLKDYKIIFQRKEFSELHKVSKTVFGELKDTWWTERLPGEKRHFEITLLCLFLLFFN